MRGHNIISLRNEKNYPSELSLSPLLIWSSKSNESLWLNQSVVGTFEASLRDGSMRGHIIISLRNEKNYPSELSLSPLLIWSSKSNESLWLNQSVVGTFEASLRDGSMRGHNIISLRNEKNYPSELSLSPLLIWSSKSNESLWLNQSVVGTREV